MQNSMTGKKVMVLKKLISGFLIILSLNCAGQKRVGLDNWFNHEMNSKSNKVYHYLWDDVANSGFSQFGNIFISKGAKLETIASKPSIEKLSKLDVYIIVDPDTTSESPNPNYILEDDIIAISQWVKKGGVLLLLANDGPNCEFTHLNKLSEMFGFHFNPVSLNPVVNKKWEMGAEFNLPNHPVFKCVSKIYLKEVSSISLNKKAKAVLTDGNGKDILMAETKYGKGFAFAVGDPWLYNEYIGNKLLPKDFENTKAAENLCEYLLRRVGK